MKKKKKLQWIRVVSQPEFTGNIGKNKLGECATMISDA